MTIRDLLAIYENKMYTDVVIMDSGLPWDNDIIATYTAKENRHDEWGQLDYFNTYYPNPLEKVFKYNVKSFEILSSLEINRPNVIFITI